MAGALRILTVAVVAVVLNPAVSVPPEAEDAAGSVIASESLVQVVQRQHSARMDRILLQQLDKYSEFFFNESRGQPQRRLFVATKTLLPASHSRELNRVPVCKSQSREMWPECGRDRKGTYYRIENRRKDQGVIVDLCAAQAGSARSADVLYQDDVPKRHCSLVDDGRCRQRFRPHLMVVWEPPLSTGCAIPTGWEPANTNKVFIELPSHCVCVRWDHDSP